MKTQVDSTKIKLSNHRKPETLALLAKYIMHPQLKDVTQALNRCIRTTGFNPSGLAIVGETGVGKSTIVKKFKEDNDVEETATHSFQTVVIVNTPAGATIKGLLTALLRELGCPRPDKGTKESMNTRALTLLKELKTQLIIFDEFQHLLSNHAQRNTQDVVDFIKNFINITGLPVVIVGMPESAHIIEADPQLARRFSAIKNIEGFSISSIEAFNYFRIFLNSLQEILPIKTINLTDEQNALRMYAACNATPALVIKIAEALVEHHSTDKQATLKDYALAYEHSISSQLSNGFNPFLATIDQVKTKLGLK